MNSYLNPDGLTLIFILIPRSFRDNGGGVRVTGKNMDEKQLISFFPRPKCQAIPRRNQNHVTLDPYERRLIGFLKKIDAKPPVTPVQTYCHFVTLLLQQVRQML
jgi:hypothetical protein